jgi:Ca2+/Na+ antiporter
MLLILFVVIGLVAWALHLMQEAVQRREFSLMLAGFLVSSAAAAMMSVYFLMSHYVLYMSEMADHLHSYVQPEYSEWIDLTDTLAEKHL